MMRRFTVATLAALTFATAAAAGQPVLLRDAIVDSDGRVTLGELFEGAGRASGVVVGVGRPGGSVVLDAATVQRVAMANGLSWQNPQGLRRVIVRSGAPARGTEALTWTRSLKTGETVGADDLAWTKVAAAPSGAPRDAEALIGMAARRPLRVGATAALRDVTQPEVIGKDEMVMVTYRMNGVSLTLQAKAIEGAAAGEVVDLVNPASKKIIQAVAVAPGRAVVGPDALAVKAAPEQFASLR